MCASIAGVSTFVPAHSDGAVAPPNQLDYVRLTGGLTLGVTLREHHTLRDSELTEQMNRIDRSNDLAKLFPPLRYRLIGVGAVSKLLKYPHPGFHPANEVGG